VNLLVTGCGGDIGQSIGKILNENDLVTHLYGCDISSNNAGKFIFNDFFIGLPVSDPNYLKSLQQIVEEKSIDFIIPISEHELRFIEKKKLSNIGNAKFICANHQAMEVGFDKLLTARFLEQNDFLFPKTELISNLKQTDFPCIAKARTGSGSQDVFILKDDLDFEYIKRKHPDFILQEYIDSDIGEFTCGLFRTLEHGTRAIILKRELMGGFSGYGEVIENDTLKKFLFKLADVLNLNGSINVQLRLTKAGPFVFEINPRFSSTVLFRHMFGFKDLIWSIEDATNSKPSDYTNVEAGKKFYKGFSEYID
jgi:carbamoyl-phosphate synthase large subunit